MLNDNLPSIADGSNITEKDKETFYQLMGLVIKNMEESGFSEEDIEATAKMLDAMLPTNKVD